MTRLNGQLLSVDEKTGVSKDGKPYFFANLGVLDEDNEFCLIRVFDRDGSLQPKVKKLKAGDKIQLKIDKLERLQNRTFDAQGQF